jgi:lipopolysaccharide export system protein LptA
MISTFILSKASILELRASSCRLQFRHSATRSSWLMARGLIYTLFVLLFTLLSLTAHAQKRVKLERADKLKRGKRGEERFERLLGNVVLIQNKTTIYCDSAHFYKKINTVEAFGKVRITEGDSVTVTALSLTYDGDKRVAKLRKNVVFTKLETATLYTDFLDYDRPKNMAFYFNNGKLVDSANVLTSAKGYYNVTTNISAFKKNVVVVNPDYTMTADSLQYNSKTKTINFVSPTTVVDKDSAVFVYEKGQYNTQQRKSDLGKGQGENETYKIEANSYSLDDVTKIYRFRGDVVMTFKEEKLVIYGQASDVDKLKNIAKVYDRAYLAKITDEGDTLFMSADTLVSIDSTDPKKKRILAYNNVKIFKKDLQGIADSVEYRMADSTIVFYNKPVLWTDENQMSADSVSMQIENNTIKQVFLKTNAFVVSEDTIIHDFNQIKGRKMTADFKNQKLHRVLVDGNAENLYFALDEKDNSLMGMNKIICSRILIRFKEGKVDTFSSYVKPEAQFIPPHELEDGDRRLRGFSWQADKRPTKRDVVKN